jgi:hypothetical protein
VGRSLGRGGAARHGRPGVCAGGPGASLEPASEQAADRRGQRRPRWRLARRVRRPGLAALAAARRRARAPQGAGAPRGARSQPPGSAAGRRSGTDQNWIANTRRRSWAQGQRRGTGAAAASVCPPSRGAVRPEPVLRGVPEVGPLSSCRAVNAVNTRSDGDRQSVRRGSSGPPVHRAADRQGAAKGGVSRWGHHGTNLHGPLHAASTPRNSLINGTSPLGAPRDSIRRCMIGSCFERVRGPHRYWNREVTSS